jgi:hypothetical protein
LPRSATQTSSCITRSIRFRRASRPSSRPPHETRQCLH